MSKHGITRRNYRSADGPWSGEVVITTARSRRRKRVIVVNVDVSIRYLSHRHSQHSTSTITRDRGERVSDDQIVDMMIPRIAELLDAARLTAARWHRSHDYHGVTVTVGEVPKLTLPDGYR